MRKRSERVHVSTFGTKFALRGIASCTMRKIGRRQIMENNADTTNTYSPGAGVLGSSSMSGGSWRTVVGSPPRHRNGKAWWMSWQLCRWSSRETQWFYYTAEQSDPMYRDQQRPFPGAEDQYKRSISPDSTASVAPPFVRSGSSWPSHIANGHCRRDRKPPPAAKVERASTLENKHV